MSSSTTAIDASRDRLAALRAGYLDDPRIHLRHASEPEPPAVTRSRAFGEAWAALSVGLLIAVLAVIVWFRILPPPLAIVVLLGSYLAIESFFDRNVMELVLRITVVLAILSALVLAVALSARAVPRRAARARAAARHRQPRGSPSPPPLTGAARVDAGTSSGRTTTIL